MDETTLAAETQQSPMPQPSPMGTFPRLMGPMALFSHAWKEFKTHWKTLVGIQIIPALLTLAFVALSLFGVIAGRGANAAALGIGAAIIALIFVIALIVVTIWSTVALLVAVRDSAENIGIGEAFKRAKGKLGSYFWISLIVGFITLGGAILLVIPGIIFAIWFSLASYVFITEGDQGMSALLKSKEYVRGYWWQVFGRMLFIGIVLWLFVFIIQLILNLLHLQVVSSLIGGALSLIITPLAVLYSFKLFNNLKEVKGQITPSQKGKGWFIAVGIFGVIGVPLIIIFAITAAILSATRSTNKINKDMMNYHYDIQQTPPLGLPDTTPTPTPQ